MSNLIGFRLPDVPPVTLRVQESGQEFGLPGVSLGDLFPPRSILDLLVLIDEGQWQQIHLIEWVRLLNDTDGWSDCAPLLSKDLVLSFLVQSMQRKDVRFMALSRMSQYLGGGECNFPEVVFDCLDEAQRSATGGSAESLELLISLRDRDHAKIVATCFRSGLLPRSYFSRNCLYFDWQHESSLSREVGMLAARQRSAVSYMHDCFSGLHDQDKISLLNAYIEGVNPKELNDAGMEWLGRLVEPFSGDYWKHLERSAQGKLLAIFGRAGLRILDGLVRKVYSEEGEGAAKYPRISQRVQFWSNYLGSIRRFRLVICEADYGRYKDVLKGVEATIYSVDKNAPMVLILDLGACVVAQFLDGGCEEIRLWSADNKAVDNLFSSVFGSPDSIRRLGFEDYSDHAYCWQSYAEGLLFKRGVMVDAEVRAFHGLRPRDGRMEKGRLAQPEFSKLMERHGKIESWLRGFWGREGRVNGCNIQIADFMIRIFEMSFGVSPKDSFGQLNLRSLPPRDLFCFLAKNTGWWSCMIGAALIVPGYGRMKVSNVRFNSDFSPRSVEVSNFGEKVAYLIEDFSQVVGRVEVSYWPLVKAVEGFCD